MGSSNSEFSLSPDARRKLTAPKGAPTVGVEGGGFLGDLGLSVREGAACSRGSRQLPQVSSASGVGIKPGSKGLEAGVRITSEVRGGRGGVLERRERS